MSTNAVICITDGNKTIRLTRYHSKPTVFLSLLITVLRKVDRLTLDEVKSALLSEGFETDVQHAVEGRPEAKFNGPFQPGMMQASLPVNWAWLLDVAQQNLSYWGVMACQQGITDTVAGSAESPLACLDRIAAHEKDEMRASFMHSFGQLESLGIRIVNQQGEQKP